MNLKYIYTPRTQLNNNTLDNNIYIILHECTSRVKTLVKHCFSTVPCPQPHSLATALLREIVLEFGGPSALFFPLSLSLWNLLGILDVTTRHTPLLKGTKRHPCSLNLLEVLILYR